MPSNLSYMVRTPQGDLPCTDSEISPSGSGACHTFELYYDRSQQ